MTPKNPVDAKAEQLRLAKELQKEFQKSGTFKGSSSAQGKGRAGTRPSKRNNQPFHHDQAARPSLPLQGAPDRAFASAVEQPRNENLTSIHGNRKRKMDAQTANFFADRPNNALERGTIQYYQDQVPAAVPTATTSPTGHAMPPMALQAATGQEASEFTLIDLSIPEEQFPAMMQPLQSTMFQNTSMGQAATPQAGSFAIPGGQVPVADYIAGPIVWHYQDNNAQPHPLARDENAMDMDMPDAASAGMQSKRRNHELTVCSCTRIRDLTPPWAWVESHRPEDSMKIDDNCPYHGTNTSYRRDNSGHHGNDYGSIYDNDSAQGASEAAPRYIGYYQ